MISAPSNFNHISHMGPGDGIQIQRLMDLPTTLETAESTPPPTAAMTAAITNPQRAKAMFTTPPLGGANKLVPGSRLPQHPGPPQRSISHNEVSFFVFHSFFVCFLECFEKLL
jgi:serine/threonine-protein kinase MRCK